MPAARKQQLIEPHQEEGLLRDLETFSCALKDIDFGQLCNNNTHFYGVSGGSLRRRFQKRFDSIKRFKFQSNYVKLLAKHNVQPNQERETMKGKSVCKMICSICF
jgi:hypothetical protein